jgi:hypothetical protein
MAGASGSAVATAGNGGEGGGGSQGGANAAGTAGKGGVGAAGGMTGGGAGQPVAGSGGSAAGGGEGGANMGGGGTGAAGSNPGGVGIVPQTCAEAALGRSSLGCSFRAVDLPNEPNTSFGPGAATAPWGIVVANPTAAAANVSITRVGAGGLVETVASSLVASGSSVELALPTLEINGVAAGEVGASARTKNALRITSDVPVAVVQLNTLAAASSSADGSVLFPESSLGRRYIVAGWRASNGYLLPVAGLVGLPDHAYVTIVGGESATTLTVKPTYDIAEGPGISAIPAGATATLSLGANEVLHLATVAKPQLTGSQPTPPVDLTGTIVEGDAPLAVFMGNERASVAGLADLPLPPGGSPDGSCCTDHLEEQLVPSDRLGTTFVVGKSPLRGTGGFVEGDVLRFVGGDEVAAVSTTLPAPYDAFSLAPGQIIDVVAITDVIVRSSKGIALAQLLVSKDATGTASGDPSFTLVPPTSAYFRHQIAVVPTSGWASRWVVLTAPVGAVIKADGAPLEGCTARASTSLSGEPTSYFSLLCPLAGTTVLDADVPFGAIAYGYDVAASFAYAITSGMTVAP